MKKLNRNLIYFALAGVVAGGIFLYSNSPRTLETFIKVEAQKRFPVVSMAGGKGKFSKLVEQKFREKMLKQVLVTEELEKDPTLYFKAENLLKKEGVLVADALVNGTTVKFLISNAEKCGLREGDELNIVDRKDLHKVCNPEFESLFAQLKNINMKIKMTGVDNIASLPEELVQDWQMLVDETLQGLALNKAFSKAKQKYWL